MKYTSEQYKQTKFVAIVALLGATSMVLYTLELATRDTISGDVQQTLFAILAILIVATINIFNAVIVTSNVSQEDLLDQDIDTVVNVYGGTYLKQTSIENKTRIEGRLDLKIPENHFDVVKTIEQVPSSEDSSHIGIRDILIHLQSYIETEPNFSIEKRKIALDRVKEIAIQAITSPDDMEIKALTTLISVVDSNSEIWHQIITALTIDTDISATKLILSLAKIQRFSPVKCVET
jgi:hypothetical protein